MWSRTSGEHVRDVEESLCRQVQNVNMEDPSKLSFFPSCCSLWQVAQRYVKALAISGDSVFTGDYANLVQQWNLATGQREAHSE